MLTKPRRGRLLVAGLLLTFFGVAVPVGLVQAASNDGSAVCEASSGSLRSAMQAYSSKCSVPRVDCDPMNGGWTCSSRQIGSAAPGKVSPAPASSTTTPTVPVVEVDGVCAATGANRAAAIDAYNSKCTQKLVDCDPIDNSGRNVCASVWMKDGVVPGGNPAPAPTTTTTGTPTTGDSPTTAAPTTAAPTTAAPTTAAPTTQPTTTKPAPTGGNSGQYGGVGLKPNLPNGPYKGWQGWSDKQVISGLKKDTRSIPPNIATFRTDCNYSHMNFDDAIVSPGQPGKAHLHVYFGNTDVDAFTNPMDVGKKGNSTCAGGIANRSAYWVPAVLDTNNGNKPLELATAIIYYKSGWDGGKPNKVVAPPNGLRVIAGNQANSASLDSNRFERTIHWACGKRGRINNNTNVGSIPKSCKQGDMLRLMISFPQCWDGKNLDSADHKSHMAYLGGSANKRKDCPKSHPVLIPRMTVNAYFKLNSTNTSGLRLSSDTYDKNKPGGLSAHADWIVGWDQQVMERMLNGCFRPADDCGHNNFNDGGGLRYPKG